MTTTDWPWQRLSQSNANAHEVLFDLIAPEPGERVLDIGTGSGGVAIRAARRGAAVTGVDAAPAAVEHAREAARAEGVDAVFDVGDAQQLPYADASYDVVVSAFGVNFAQDHRAAAREIARVCRGRIGLALMPPESRAGATWTVLRRYARPDGDHPASWGTEERARELLGGAFDLDVRAFESPPEPEREPAEVWEFMRTSFGPVKALVERLDPATVERLREELLDARAAYAGRPATYLVVLGRRR